MVPAKHELQSVITFLHANKIPPIEIHHQLEEVKNGAENSLLAA